MDRRQSPSRAGFTLVEVLVAILIVALLVALLLPAIRGAFRRAQEAQVAAELNNLATALASFKNTYGDYPPSRIYLCEAGYNNSGLSAAALSGPAGPLSTSGNDTDISLAQLIQRSKIYLRRIWPRVDFDNGTNGTLTAGFDFNGDGTIGGNWNLTGSECLAFFLGGLPVQNNGSFSMSGFSKLPTDPFLMLNPAVVTSTNRSVPNYEFVSGRLVDLDGDGFPSYLDPLDQTQNQRAYAYFVSYGTNSYDPNDDNGNGREFAFEDEDDGTTIVERGYTVGFPNSAGANSVISAAPNPYVTGTPITTGGMTWINPNGFQLFSCGQDRLWGLGGTYVQNSLGSTGKLPIVASDPGLINPVDASNGIRYRESDNITNFSGGRLD
jgi:prepilin-type N-terminal cleavage/methylation domain-containing protein